MPVSPNPNNNWLPSLHRSMVFRERNGENHGKEVVKIMVSNLWLRWCKINSKQKAKQKKKKNEQQFNSNKQERKILALLSELETKGDIKNSGIEGIKTTLIVPGGAIVERRSRPSLLLGIGTIAAGHYFDSKRFVNLGVGITAGGGIATAESLKGTDETLCGKFKKRTEGIWSGSETPSLRW